ncbi:Serine/threonine kinase [Pichia californica]|uniref:protein kinase C n=1 Tax=Pichia californica TaxID=460514 RepID=A0A9P7BIH9_9ASCO|nr:Serine/threonine kinase [[Candida] californica]
MSSIPTNNKDKLNDILKKIDREKKLAEGATNVRKRTNNPAVIQKCNTQVREAQKNIEYLESMLKKLQIVSISDSNNNSINKDQNNTTTKSYNQVRQRPLFTALDLLKYDCPSLGHKIQYMMQMLEFKIQVETQYKEANEKMYNLYQVEGDRSSIAMAERGRSESDRKLQLMKRALKEYHSMYIDFDDISRENAMINTVRKNPLSGVLFIQIQAIKNVDHIQSPLFSRNPECIISIKIDDNEKARTKGSRNDRWADFFDINVEKANELSLTVYDKIDDELIPVGLFWLSLSDVAEEMRRKKVKQERVTSEHWVNGEDKSISTTSTLLNPTMEISSKGSLQKIPNSGGMLDPATSSSSGSSSSIVRSTDWFGIEPSGEILLTLGFVKTNENKNRTDHSNFTSGLGRHGAIRQRKEEIVESQGHRFVQKQFYNIMSCAVCNEFLRYTGYQCEDCLFLCHQKCIKNIIAKCISKSSSDISSEETKLNHRIPHRFTAVTNRGAKWCCHCGYILPFGKKNVRKCEECGIMCHANCMHYVPDLCGISPKTIEKILEALRASQQKNKNKPLPPIKTVTPVETTTPLSKQPTTSASSTLLNLPINNVEISPHKNNLNKYTSSNEDSYYQFQHTTFTNIDNENKIAEITGDNSTIHTTITQNNNKNDINKNKNNNYVSEHNIDTSFQGQDMYPSRAVTRTSLEEAADKETYNNVFTREEIHEDYVKTIDDKNIIKHQSSEIQFSHSVKIPPYPESKSAPLNMEVSESTIIEKQSLQPQPQTQPQHQHHHHRHHQKRRHRRSRYGLDDYRFLSVLGKGNFGKVMLAEYVNNNKLCAIKVLKKNFIVENDEVESTKSEKRVFLVANKNNHPFLLNLYQCFQTENRIYFVMEYISGGDLMWHVQQKKFSLRRAQFYASEILLALKFLHDNGIIYRDLKLDNIMLTTEGHIKLADYGLCKENMWFGKKTRTFCGTPELMAPEIISGEQTYDKAVDWWAFGVLLYQMILTKTPFKGDDEEEVFNAILTDDPLYPISMSKEAVDIIQKLLTRDPKLRLGSSERDALEIMEHPYFGDVNFDDIFEKKVIPPYKPEVNDPRDAKCFEEEFTSQAAKLTPVNSVLSPKLQEMFRGFTYSCDDDN